MTHRSEALWREGAFALHQRSIEWPTALGFYPHRLENLSRVDCTFDYHAPEIDVDEDDFLTLSVKDSKYRSNQKAQGFYFGQSDAMLRVYDVKASCTMARYAN